MIFRIVGGAVLLANSLPPDLHAQDSARVEKLPEVVVSAERAPTSLARSTATVTLLRRDELQALPVRTLAEALRHIAGLAFVDFAGLDSDPQPMVRGFYGGGEAEYVLLLVDGEPVNAVGSGRVNWDLIPLSAIESVEVLMGPASPLYGDAAIGAVIRVNTIRAGSRTSWSASGGQHGLARASWSTANRGETSAIAAFADASRHTGFRTHSRRGAHTLGATLGIGKPGQAAVEFSLLTHDRSFEEPGPLPETALSTPEKSSVFFRFDETDERFWRLAARSTRTLGGAGLITAHAAIDDSRVDAVRTIPLAADFADTKRRDLRATRLLGVGQLELRHSIFSRAARVVIGTELSHGRTGSTYFTHASGDAATYSAAPAGDPELDTETDARRLTAAVFVQQELDLSSAVRLVVGARGDRLSDAAYQPSIDSDRRSAKHAAFSPRAAANLAYAQTARQRGHFYLSAGRSFKAPTPDQLYDQRSVPIPFPPFAATFSNSLLQPQRATNVEAGIRHWITDGEHSIVDLSLSGHAIEMEDELDFDVQQLRFVNIGRSRHRGAEGSVKVPFGRIATAFATYSLQRAVSRSGPNFDKQLKAIPRRSARLGVSVSPGPVNASVVATVQGHAFLDDANTVRLPGYIRFDTRVSVRIRGFRIWTDLFNLLDRTYSTTGFPDPSGSGLMFYHPAARRVLQIGLSNSP